MTPHLNLGPLASVGVRGSSGLDEPSSATSSPRTRPLALRVMRPAPHRDLPSYVYDLRRQVATDPAGTPLQPSLAKDWTTDGTHTDGDGGDNEGWGWEEV